jgi:hypothetical protein
MALARRSPAIIDVRMRKSRAEARSAAVSSVCYMALDSLCRRPSQTPRPESGRTYTVAEVDQLG